MRLKTALVNLSLIALSSAAGLLLCEFAVRSILNPSDYLQVEMAKHEILGAVPSTSTAGGAFDEWGFRNRLVPNGTDIVAIGDSHTYGNTATMNDSWPYVLSRLSGRPVYNMGLGGYGPNQYLHLLKTRALKLKPKTIIVGLYMGDDFENAFLMTYGLEHWAYLRELPPERVNFDIWEAPPAPSWHKRLRVWLSQHSVIYQILFHGSLLGRAQGEAQIKNAQWLHDSVSVLTIPEKDILEAFSPKGILRRLDQDKDSVREGMRITFKLLAEMNEICEQNQIKFLVTVIPTKEMVFSEYIENNSKIALSGTIDKLLTNERLAREKTFEFLRHSKIPYIDTLPRLRSSIEQQLYARSAADMHPGKNGYLVIGEAAFYVLK